MKTCLAIAVVALAAAILPARAQAPKTGVDKLYVINCGEGSGDMSRWTPGLNAGVTLEISDNCYLIHHTNGWFLWDTGIVDSIADKPDGTKGENGSPNWRRPKKLVDSLAELGLKPDDIKFMAVSHTHPDHVGNVELFPKSMLYVQKAEYDWPVPLGVGRFKPEHPVTKLEGDKDVFGDGSLTLISTPGHTPGHQSLLVKLPKTGAVLLSGDAVHFKDNWEHRRVPGGNTDKDATVASMQKMAGVIEREHAQLWINHDKVQTATLKHAPEFYE